MKKPLTTIEEAIPFAANLHQGQFRRDGKTPYFTHLMRVRQRLKDEPENVQIAALLHDSIEDERISVTGLRDWIPEDSFIAVLTLTKTHGEDYQDYLWRVRQNPIALKVKIADMLDNISDSPTTAQIRRYAQGLLFLTEEL